MNYLNAFKICIKLFLMYKKAYEFLYVLQLEQELPQSKQMGN